MAKDLGNAAPPAITNLENLLFDGLLRIARGQSTSASVLEDFVSAVPQSTLDSLDETVSGWFSAGTFHSTLRSLNTNFPVASFMCAAKDG